MVYLIIGIITWYLIGVSSFVFWWTKDWDLHVDDALIGSIVGLGGPVTFVVGWIVHGDPISLSRVVLIKKRK